MKVTVGCTTIAVLALILLPVRALSAEDIPDNYSKAEAVAAKPVQLNIHASATKDCKAAPLPSINLLERPEHGTLLVRRGVLTTNRIPSCPNLKVPAQVVFYTARDNFVGRDHVVYKIVSFNGQEQKFDIEIEVKAAGVPPAPIQDRI